MLRLLHSQTFPDSINDPIFVCHSGKIIRQIRRPLDVTAEFNHSMLFKKMGVENLMKLFYTILLEGRILVLGTSMAQISIVVESLCALLEPCSWHHTLVSNYKKQAYKITTFKTYILFRFLYCHMV